jgi:chitinase
MSPMPRMEQLPRLAKPRRMPGCRAFLIAVALLLLLPVFDLWSQTPETARPQIIAYVFPQETPVAPGSIDAAHLTRINYAFANIKDGRIIEGFPHEAQNLAALVALKQQNPSLQVLVSVGGWSWSEDFSSMALTPESRAAFIDSVMAYIARYHLDGLDIDWEYPGIVGATNHFRPDDGAHFAALLAALRARFDAEQQKTHHRLYLSIAAGSSDDYLAHSPMGEIAPSLDTVNLMAYDYYEPSDDKKTGNHAPLHIDPKDPKAVSSEASVRAFEKVGVPASKLVLGVPFYGHVWGDVPATNHGLFEPGRPVQGAYAGYSAIVTNMLGHGYTRYWDKAAEVPYLYNPSKHIFVSYEDPESLRLKCRYVRQHHLAGIMFWDYKGDPSGTLLRTVYDALYPSH